MVRLAERQRTSVLALWATLPLHMRSIHFDFHRQGWTPDVIDTLDNLLGEFQYLFHISHGIESCSLLPFTIVVTSGQCSCHVEALSDEPAEAKQADMILDEYLSAGLTQHSKSPYSSPIVAIKKSGGIRITSNYIV